MPVSSGNCKAFCICASLLTTNARRQSIKTLAVDVREEAFASRASSFYWLFFSGGPPRPCACAPGSSDVAEGVHGCSLAVRGPWNRVGGCPACWIERLACGAARRRRGLPRGDAAKLCVLCYPGSAAERLRPLPMVLPRGEGLRRGVGRARTAVAHDVPRRAPGRAALSLLPRLAKRAPRRSNLARIVCRSSPDGR